MPPFDKDSSGHEDQRQEQQVERQERQSPLPQQQEQQQQQLRTAENDQGQPGTAGNDQEQARGIPSRSMRPVYITFNLYFPREFPTSGPQNQQQSQLQQEQQTQSQAHQEEQMGHRQSRVFPTPTESAPINGPRRRRNQQQQQQHQQHSFVQFFLPIFFIPEAGLPQGMFFSQWDHHQFHQQQQQQQRTVSKSVLDQLPVIRLSEERKQVIQTCHPEDDVCALCQEEFELDQQLVMLPCQHVFHNNCGVREWLTEHSNVCPLCRFELPIQDPELEAERVKRMTERLGDSGVEVLNINMKVENLLERLASTARLFRQRKNVDNLKSQDVRKMIADIGDIDADLMDSMCKLDAIDIKDFKEERTRQQRRTCILKIQSMQQMIDVRRRDMQSFLDELVK